MTAAAAGGGRRPALGAWVPPKVAVLMARDDGDDGVMARLALLASTYERAVDPQTREAGQEARWVLGQVREAARLWRLRNQDQAGAGSEEVSTEVRETAGGSGSGCLLGADGGSLSVSEVAARFDRSERWVLTLIDREVLVATRLSSRGRPWAIDEASVEEYEQTRRNVA